MEITANSIQTVTSNSNILFDTVVIPGNCSIIYRPGSGLVTLRGLTNGQCRARFKVSFNGNVAADTTIGAISVAISLNGEPILSSNMISTPAAVDEYDNISSSIYIDIPSGCCGQISVKNTSTQSILTQNANLLIERVA